MNWVVTNNIYPMINFMLIIVLIGLLIVALIVMERRTRNHAVWDEIAALRLRMDVQEQVAPCEHCRMHHGHPGDHCDECP